LCAAGGGESVVRLFAVFGRVETRKELAEAKDPEADGKEDDGDAEQGLDFYGALCSVLGIRTSKQ